MDLCRLAGLSPVSAICEILGEDETRREVGPDYVQFGYDDYSCAEAEDNGRYIWTAYGAATGAAYLLCTLTLGAPSASARRWTRCATSWANRAWCRSTN